MKKLINISVTVVLFLICLSIFVSAGTLAEDFPVYKAGQNNNLTWKIENSTLFINGNDAMTEFYVWGSDTEHPEWYLIETNAPWRDSKAEIKTIVIGEGVTTIGWFAFYNFENLETVYIPTTLTLVQKGAFGKCAKLKDINFAATKDNFNNMLIEDSSDTNKSFVDANWNENKPYDDGNHTVTYVLNGGKNNAANPATYKTGTAVTLKNPTRTGYTFSGWYTDSSFKTKITSISATANKNYTLYAKWTANKYKIVFNKNTATSGSMSALICTYGKTSILTANTFKKTNYTFTGWNTKADGSGTSYKNKASVKNLSSKSGATVTLYAQWKRTTYTIVFDGNGATSGSTASIKAKTGVNYTLTANGYKRSCYSFVGWNTKSDGSGTLYKNKAAVKDLKKTDGAKITLYAQWKLNSNCYVISYKLNGGTNSTKNPLAYSKTGSSIKLIAPTRTGYTFGGWYTDSALTKKITTIKTGSTGAKTLYAKWTANKYTVKFNKNGATSGTMSSMTCIYNKSYNLTANAFKKTGTQFLGWNTKADGTGKTYKNKAAIKNLSAKNGAVVTLYAQWGAAVKSGVEGNIKWAIYDSGLLSLSKGNGTMMNNYTVITTTMNFGATIRTSTAPWAARGDGTRNLVKSVKINSGIVNIGNYAFTDCYNMTEITIPASVTSIGVGSFLGCSGLKTVYFEGSEAQWNKITIQKSNDALLEADIKFAK